MSDTIPDDTQAGNHTPGPWVQTCESIDPDWHIVTTKGGAVIANVFAPQSANARLIAAAPDMLAVLQAIDPKRIGSGPSTDLYALHNAQMNARAAIAKVEGSA